MASKSKGSNAKKNQSIPLGGHHYVSAPGGGSLGGGKGGVPGITPRRDLVPGVPNPPRWDMGPGIPPRRDL